MQEEKFKRQKFSEKIQKEIKYIEKRISSKSNDNTSLNTGVLNFLERKSKKKLKSQKRGDGDLIAESPLEIFSKMGKECTDAAFTAVKVCSTEIFHHLPQTFCIKKFDWPISPTCPDGTERLFFSCQDKCPSSYKKHFGICIEECPQGYSDWGLWCHEGWFNFKGKKFKIPSITSYLDESVTCPGSLVKNLGLCYKDCRKIGLKDYWGVCASNGSQLTIEFITRTVKLIFSVLKFFAFFFSGGTSSSVSSTAHSAFDEAIKSLKIYKFDTDDLAKKLVEIGIDKVIESGLTNLGVKLAGSTINKTCKSEAKTYCKQIIEKQYENSISSIKERKTEQEKQFMDYLDFIGIGKTYQDCKNDAFSSECLGNLLKKAEKFDPTGISGIASVFVAPFCKIPEDNIVELEISAIPEDVWFQIVTPNENREDQDKSNCLSFDGFKKQIVIKECDEDNEEQFFLLTKYENNSYYIMNKSSLYVKYEFLKEKKQNSFIVDLLPNAASYIPRDFIFHITKQVQVDETLKENSGITENPNNIKIIIQPKNSGESNEKLCLEKSGGNTLKMSNCESKLSKHIFKIMIHPNQEKFIDIDLSLTYLIQAMKQLNYNYPICLKCGPFYKKIAFDNCSENLLANHWNFIKSSYGGYEIINKTSKLPLGIDLNTIYDKKEDKYNISATVAFPKETSNILLANLIPWKNKEGFYRFELMNNPKNYHGRLFLDKDGYFDVRYSYDNLKEKYKLKSQFKLEISNENAVLQSSHIMFKSAIGGPPSFCVVDKNRNDENLYFEVCNEKYKNQYWKFIPQEAPFYKIETLNRPGNFLKAVENYFSKNMIVLSKDPIVENFDEMLWIVHVADKYFSIINKKTKECAMMNPNWFDLGCCTDSNLSILFKLE